MCVNFFSVKDFSGTTCPRILKFGTNLRYVKLYCVKENQLPPAYHFLYFVHFSFIQIKISVTDFSAPIRDMVFKLCIHVHSEAGKVHCVKENHEVYMYCCLLFPFFLFSTIHSHVTHMEIFCQRFLRNYLKYSKK